MHSAIDWLVGLFRVKHYRLFKDRRLLPRPHPILIRRLNPANCFPKHSLLWLYGTPPLQHFLLFSRDTVRPGQDVYEGTPGETWHAIRVCTKCSPVGIKYLLNNYTAAILFRRFRCRCLLLFRRLLLLNTTPGEVGEPQRARPCM